VMIVPTGYKSYTDASSVYRAETFTGNTTLPLSRNSAAQSLGFSIAPRGSITFDIVDTWMMPRAGIR
jgi:hypothetical protein